MSRVDSRTDCGIRSNVYLIIISMKSGCDHIFINENISHTVFGRWTLPFTLSAFKNSAAELVEFHSQSLVLFVIAANVVQVLIPSGSTYSSRWNRVHECRYHFLLTSLYYVVCTARWKQNSNQPLHIAHNFIVSDCSYFKKIETVKRMKLMLY